MEIKNVVVFSNGMAMVFDSEGQQMPEYQGRWDDLKDKIVEASSDKTTFEVEISRSYFIKVTKDKAAKLSADGVMLVFS